MAAFVLDASATLPWCFKDEESSFSRGLLARVVRGEEVIVAAHWPVEVLNTLLQAQRRGRVAESDIDLFLKALSTFEIALEDRPHAEQMAAIRIVAEKHGLTAYDAAYLELAKRRGLPLATLDAALIKACGAEEVPVLTFVAS